MNDSNYSASGIDELAYDSEFVSQKLFKTRLLLILMALLKISFYMYCLVQRISAGGREINAEVAILIAFALSVEVIGIIAVLASSLLGTIVYLLLILLQMTISAVYPQNPKLTLNLLAHIVDMALIGAFLFKLNQFDVAGGGGGGSRRRESAAAGRETVKEVTV